MSRVETVFGTGNGSDNHFIVDDRNLVSIRVGFHFDVPQGLRDDMNDAINQLLCDFQPRVDAEVKEDEGD